MSATALDVFARPLRTLRMSVTDRCNLRCAYCMPREDYAWLERDEVLSLEELAQVTAALAPLGLRRVRLTGGEPLLRRGLTQLVAALAAQPLEDLGLTTNGVRLAELAAPLAAAGLRRVTVSLDTLRPSRFVTLTRRDHHAQVLAGLDAARRAGLALKLDTVLMRGVNDDEVLPMLEFAQALGAELRFIEYMDVGGATAWSLDKVVSRAELLARLERHFGAVHPFGPRGAAPAERFQLPDGQVFGIVASTTTPFCAACDRARLTADGQLYTCLYAQRGLDLRGLLRAGQPLAPAVQQLWAARADRGSEARARLGERGPSSTVAGLAGDVHLEMHTRGG